MTITQTGKDASASIGTYNDVGKNQHNTTNNTTIGNMANGQIEADDIGEKVRNYVRSILGTGNSGNTISYNNVTNDNSHSNTSNLVNNGQAYFHTAHSELPLTPSGTLRPDPQSITLDEKHPEQSSDEEESAKAHTMAEKFAAPGRQCNTREVDPKKKANVKEICTMFTATEARPATAKLEYQARMEADRELLKEKAIVEERPAAEEESEAHVMRKRQGQVEMDCKWQAMPDAEKECTRKSEARLVQERKAREEIRVMLTMEEHHRRESEQGSQDLVDMDRELQKEKAVVEGLRARLAAEEDRHKESEANAKRERQEADRKWQAKQDVEKERTRKLEARLADMRAMLTTEKNRRKESEASVKRERQACVEIDRKLQKEKAVVKELRARLAVVGRSLRPIF